MWGIRARSLLGASGRALFALRSSSQCPRRILDGSAREELFRHVPSRSVGSFLEGRFSRHYGTMRFKDSAKLIELQWVTSKSLPQGVPVLSIPFHSSQSSRRPTVGRRSLAVSKVAGEDAKTAGMNAKAVRGGPVSWASLALLVTTGVGLILFWDREKKRQLEELRSEKGPVAKTGPGVGKAAIGGPFKLINQDGKVVSDRDFVGNWTLIYFGFTYRPEICPDELIKLAEAVDQIEKKEGLQVCGLTGSVEDIRQVAREFRVYYMKTEDEGSHYLVDHSIITYLRDPDKNFVKFFGKNYDANSIADGVITEIKSIAKK